MWDWRSYNQRASPVAQPTVFHYCRSLEQQKAHFYFHRRWPEVIGGEPGLLVPMDAEGGHRFVSQMFNNSVHYLVSIFYG